MERVQVVLIELPHTIRGLTVYYFDDDGEVYYTILINSHMSDKMQCATYDHEIAHIDNGDFEKMYSIDVLEDIRHAV